MEKSTDGEDPGWSGPFNNPRLPRTSISATKEFLELRSSDLRDDKVIFFNTHAGFSGRDFSTVESESAWQSPRDKSSSRKEGMDIQAHDSSSSPERLGRLHTSSRTDKADRRFSNFALHKRRTSIEKYAVGLRLWVGMNTVETVFEISADTECPESLDSLLVPRPSAIPSFLPNNPL
ncbi:hypothetical protein L218DRAFT_945257 [Marasmius fiardii PR-910]|nr:hypothetical protein L218DRAFT_945257 [Marasmius fiardii PR-910]